MSLSPFAQTIRNKMLKDWFEHGWVVASDRSFAPYTGSEVWPFFVELADTGFLTIGWNARCPLCSEQIHYAEKNDAIFTYKDVPPGPGFCDYCGEEYDPSEIYIQATVRLKYRPQRMMDSESVKTFLATCKMRSEDWKNEQQRQEANKSTSAVMFFASKAMHERYEKLIKEIESIMKDDTEMMHEVSKS